MTTAPWGTTRMGLYPESSPFPALTPVIDPETQVAVFVDEHGRTVEMGAHGTSTSGLTPCPHMFQAKVDKAFDVRATSVGDRLFGMRIDSPDLDWRQRQDRMTCTAIDIPEPVTRSVVAYLGEFRLVYGAFDFAVAASGDWYFLECNPNGQWAWQPAETTTAIAHAIADQLTKGSDT